MSIIQSNIHRNATIGKGTVIEPFATIQEDVVLGENCWEIGRAHV